MPRISILLTCYNHLDFLKPCLASIQSQTCQDFEVLALDDGSTDGTREFLAEWIATHRKGDDYPFADPSPENLADRTRLIYHDKNMGTYPSLNVGVEQAKGEFIAVLNDDDLWAPDKLASQLDMLEANPQIGLCHTYGYFIDEHGARQDKTVLNFDFPRGRTGFVFPLLVRHNRIINSSTLIRKAAFDRVGTFDPEFYGCGDWDMWLRISVDFEVGFIDELLTFYRVHGQNACLDADRMRIDDQRVREKAAQQSDRMLVAHPGDDELKAALAHNWACLGTVRTLHGDPGGGRQAYWNSIRLVPGRVKSWLRILLTFLPTNWFKKFI